MAVLTVDSPSLRIGFLKHVVDRVYILTYIYIYIYIYVHIYIYNFDSKIKELLYKSINEILANNYMETEQKIRQSNNCDIYIYIYNNIISNNSNYFNLIITRMS